MSQRRTRSRFREHKQSFLPDSVEEAFGFGVLVFISATAGCNSVLKDDN